MLVALVWSTQSQPQTNSTTADSAAESAKSSASALSIEAATSPTAAAVDQTGSAESAALDTAPLDSFVPTEPDQRSLTNADALSASSSTNLNQLGLSPSLTNASPENVASTTKPENMPAGDKSMGSVETVPSGSNEPVAAETALADVRQAWAQAQAEDKVVEPNRQRDTVQDTHGNPWVLSRDTMRYRVTLSPKLDVNARQSQWTLALEPIDGLVVEPLRPVTLTAQGIATWRIYEADAKSPRALLIVRALHHGREGKLELAFCGGAEDMPGVAVPLAERWLLPLTVRVQTGALQLRGALDKLSTTVILRDQVPAAIQHKQALTAQMLQAARLGAVLPEINRLAQLVDGQVTMHAALRSKPDEPPVATWGTIQ
jgi:hypothetical protein